MADDQCPQQCKDRYRWCCDNAKMPIMQRIAINAGWFAITVALCIVVSIGTVQFIDWMDWWVY